MTGEAMPIYVADYVLMYGTGQLWELQHMTKGTSILLHTWGYLAHKLLSKSWR